MSHVIPFPRLTLANAAREDDWRRMEAAAEMLCAANRQCAEAAARFRHNVTRLGTAFDGLEASAAHCDAALASLDGKLAALDAVTAMLLEIE